MNEVAGRHGAKCHAYHQGYGSEAFVSAHVLMCLDLTAPRIF